jgi:hypothetical protein
MTFLELAKKVLEEIGEPLSSEEIWKIAQEKGYDKEIGSKGKTPWATLGALLYSSTKKDNPDSPFVRIGARPTKFYLKGKEPKSLENPTPTEPPITEKSDFDLLEKHLHGYLTYYAFHYLRCYTKSIAHSKSPKKAFSEWLHPDMVGCDYSPLEDWSREVYELSLATGNITIRLLSFEIKRELNFGNLRESFFQTVSNSSWANESYLVAAEISEENEFRNELSRLSTSFGIGIIKLNIEDPDSSEIVFPAKYRETLDWETINKLAMNPDFKEFIDRVKIDLSSKKPHKSEYNKVPSIEELKRNLLKES